MLTDAYIAFGVLLIVLSLPLVFGLVPPNRWYGIRLPGFQSPERWYPLHRRGGLIFVVEGAVLVLVGVLLHWLVPSLSQ